jgi:hypothetical protein
MAHKWTQLVSRRSPTPELPPILAGTATPVIRQNVGRFYASVAKIFEAWVARRSSHHTQRAYRSDVMSFVRFLGLQWPQQAPELLRVSIKDVQAFRDRLEEGGAAPKTLNRRISSVSSFYKYLAGAAAELRLPITVPNPAHAQFISRASSDPREETRSLSATRARQLMGLPAGDTLIDFRDRAILKFYLYSGVSDHRKTYFFGLSPTGHRSRQPRLWRGIGGNGSVQRLNRPQIEHRQRVGERRGAGELIVPPP